MTAFAGNWDEYMNVGSINMCPLTSIMMRIGNWELFRGHLGGVREGTIILVDWGICRIHRVLFAQSQHRDSVSGPPHVTIRRLSHGCFHADSMAKLKTQNCGVLFFCNASYFRWRSSFFGLIHLLRPITPVQNLTRPKSTTFSESSGR